MPSLLGLPTELRQQILLLALPDTSRIDRSWPAQISSLAQVNKSIFLDLTAVIELWSPLHYICFASSIRDLQPRTLNLNGRAYTPKLERVCLDLFYASDVSRMKWTCYCIGRFSWKHPDSTEAWAAAIPQIPDYIKDIWLDVTPAPALKQDQHPIILNQLVHDKCVSQKFLGRLVQDVAALVRQIEQHHGGQAQIGLTGTLSTKSKFFVDAVNMRAERKLEFMGRWVSSDDAQFKSLHEAVQRITSRKVTWQGKRPGDNHPLLWLRTVLWDRRTVFLFARLANEGLEVEAVDDLRKIAESNRRKGKLVMEPVGSLRRAFQHRVAAHMYLRTVVEGEGAESHVVVGR